MTLLSTLDRLLLSDGGPCKAGALLSSLSGCTE